MPFAVTAPKHLLNLVPRRVSSLVFNTQNVVYSVNTQDDTVRDHGQHA